MVDAQQPFNFNFDYHGPPVTVSNSMALQLVSQFGVQNAWFAFLKVRGLTLSSEDAEKAVALKVFRAKIKRTKKIADDLKDRKDELESFMSQQFDTFLQTNSIELKEGCDEDLNDEADDVEQNESVTTNNLSQIQEKVNPPITTLSETEKTENDGEKLPHRSDGTTNKSNNTIANTDDTVGSSTVTNDEILKTRHDTTIDDAVSSVMNKIKNNELFVGELAPSKQSTSRSHKRNALPSVITTKSFSTASEVPFTPYTTAVGSSASQQIPSSHQQPMIFVPPSTTMKPSGSDHLFTKQTARQIHQNVASSIGYNHNQHDQSQPHQVTILSNFNDIIRATSSGQQIGMTTTKIMTSQPQQPSQTVQMPSTIPLQVGGQFPLTLPIHGNVLGNFSLSGLPSQAINLQSGSVSVQALIQSLQQQVKQQQQPPPQHSSSQLEPDSSSQDAQPTISSPHIPPASGPAMVAAMTTGAKQTSKSRKRPAAPKSKQEKIHDKVAMKQPATEPKSEKMTSPQQQSQQQPKQETPQETTQTHAYQKVSRLPTKKPKVEATTTSTQNIVIKDGIKSVDGEKMADLESQVKKLQRQLSAEKNKSLAQKRKLEKLQGEYNKASDSIQLLQIDLACQKTDCNNLSAENIALKAELQQLKNKETSSKYKSKKSVTLASEKPTSSKKGRPKKMKFSSKEKESQDGGTDSSSVPMYEPPSLSLSDLGRRQSKRICVARNRFPFV